MHLKLCVFDLDNTLLKVNSSFKYYLYLHKKKFFSNISILRAFRYFVKFSLFSLSPTELHKEIFEKFLKGRNRTEIFGRVEEFLDLFLDSFLNQKVLKILKRAKKENQFVLLLSNSPEELAVPIAKRLGIKNARATSYSKSKDGTLNEILQLMDGKMKAKYTLEVAKKENIDLEAIEVFTDSIWDRPLLEMAGKCFVVNPDKKLFALAKAKGWNFI